MKYENREVYVLNICGLRRELPVIRVAPDLWIASFVMLGDSQLVNVCAGALASRIAAYDFDYLVGPEAKVIPLLQSMSTLLGLPRYIVCRKSVKAYMQNPLVVKARSITTRGEQTLVLDGTDVDRVRGKRVVIVDDVVSTGGSLEAVENLLKKAGAHIVVRATVLKEGSFYSRDLVYLGDLPVFEG